MTVTIYLPSFAFETLVTCVFTVMTHRILRYFRSNRSGQPLPASSTVMTDDGQNGPGHPLQPGATLDGANVLDRNAPEEHDHVIYSNFKSALLILKEVGEMAAQLPFIKGVAGIALQLTKIKEDISACISKRTEVQGHIDQLKLIISSQREDLVSEDIRVALRSFKRDLDHCWARLESQKATTLKDRILSAVYRADLLSAIEKCEETTSRALSYITLRIIITNHQGIYSLVQSKAAEESTIISEFHVIRRGDIEVLSTLYDKEDSSTGICDLDLTGRMYDEHCSDLSSGYGAIRRNWISKVHGSSGEHLVRVYEGPDSVKAMLEDLNFYHQFFHPSIIQVFGVCRERPALVFHGGTFCSWDDYDKSCTSEEASFRAHNAVVRDLANVSDYLRFHKLRGLFVINSTLVNIATGRICIVDFYDCHSEPQLSFNPVAPQREIGVSERHDIANGVESFTWIADAQTVDHIYTKITARAPFPMGYQRFSKALFLASIPKRIPLRQFGTFINLLKRSNPRKLAIRAFGKFTEVNGRNNPEITGLIFTDDFQQMKAPDHPTLSYLPALFDGRTCRNFSWKAKSTSGNMAVVRPGWSRLTVKSPFDIFASVELADDYSTTDLDSALTQSSLSDNLLIWEHILVLSIQINKDAFNGNEPISTVAYIFFEDINIDSTGHILPSQIFWSDDSEGHHKWTEEQVASYLQQWCLTTEDLEVDVHTRSGGGEISQGGLEKLHKRRKLKAENGQMTPFFGFPLM